MSDIFDVALTLQEKGRAKSIQAHVCLPVGISKTLRSRGCNRVQVEVTEAGILLRPYKGAGRAYEALDLPAWDGP